MMVHQELKAPQETPVSQATRGLLETLVYLVAEETRDRMGYLDLLERKEPWDVLELDLKAQTERKVHPDVLEKRVLLVPVDPLGLWVLKEIEGFPVFLDLLVLLVILA